MRRLVLLICFLCCCYLSTVLPATTRQAHCPCKDKKPLNFIPPKADCLWIHRSDGSCGNEVAAHFPPTVLKKDGKPRKPLCLNYTYVDHVVKNVTNDGTYCIHKTNVTEWLLTTCTNCTSENLYQRVSDIRETEWWLWQRMPSWWN
uniref:Chemokine vCXCL1A n=1 Tax=Simian cytomegalovirus (strain Colburn) TaxID=50292 RepID=D2E2Y8_SCMVC|nr:chemokine vCXCL1A [Cercopithecine betaherpesvirus 5]